MSKFCTNCGSILDDNAMFCPNCGAVDGQSNEETAPAPAPVNDDPFSYGGAPSYTEDAPAYVEEQPQEKANPLKGITDKLGDMKNLIIGAVAAIAVIFLCVLLFGSNPNKAIKNYEAVMNGNAGKVTSLAPGAYWKYVKDEEDVTKSDVKKEFKDQWEDLKEEMEDQYGKNVKIKIKVTDKKKMSKKDLEEIAEKIEDNYEIDEKKVKAGWEMECEMTIKGREDDDEVENTLYVVKISGKWYVVSPYGSFYVDSWVD